MWAGEWQVVGSIVKIIFFLGCENIHWFRDVLFYWEYRGLLDTLRTHTGNGASHRVLSEFICRVWEYTLISWCILLRIHRTFGHPTHAGHTLRQWGESFVPVRIFVVGCGNIHSFRDVFYRGYRGLSDTLHTHAGNGASHWFLSEFICRVWEYTLISWCILPRIQRTFWHPTHTRRQWGGLSDPFRIFWATGRHSQSHAGVHCNTLQHTATHCTTLHHTATPYTTLQHPAPHCNTL